MEIQGKYSKNSLFLVIFQVKESLSNSDLTGFGASL